VAFNAVSPKIVTRVELNTIRGWTVSCRPRAAPRDDRTSVARLTLG
jgi:hypothetical protein